jgi:hypothetical protein
MDLTKLGLNAQQLEAAQRYLAQNPKAKVADVLKAVGASENPDLKGLDKEPDFGGAQTVAKGTRCAGTTDAPDFSGAKTAVKQKGTRCAGTTDAPDFSGAQVKEKGTRCAGTTDTAKPEKK